MKLGRWLGAGLWLVVAGCDVAPDDMQFLCSDGITCPDGQTCVVGVCRDVLVDAAIDVVEIDGSMDAGGSEDGGVEDAAVDAPTDAPLPTDEVCAPDPTGHGVDEDLDGLIDEGCVYRFGTPHPVTDIHGPNLHFSPELTDDGLLYFVRAGSEGNGIWRSERLSDFEKFRAPSLEFGFGGGLIDSMSVTGDGSEFVVQIGGQLRQVVEGTIEPGLALGVEAAYHPSLSRDGTELYFAGEVGADRRIYRSQRITDGSFGPGVRVFPESTEREEFPSLSRDGSTLWYTSAAGMRIAVRAEGEMFTTSLPFEGLPVAAAQPFYHPPTREMFYVQRGAVEWSPTDHSIWRVQVCRTRTGACEVDPIPCESGNRSDNGNHCYESTADPTSFSAAAARCLSEGGHLVTIHSAEEENIVNRTATLPTWIGGSRGPGGNEWVTMEPFLFSRIDRAPPDGCLALNAIGGWAPLDCEGTRIASVCEWDRWPVWVDDAP